MNSLQMSAFPAGADNTARTGRFFLFFLSPRRKLKPLCLCGNRETRLVHVAFAARFLAGLFCTTSYNLGVDGPSFWFSNVGRLPCLYVQADCWCLFVVDNVPHALFEA